MSFRWQESLKTQFDKYFENESIKGVAQAIVFGYKEDLDDEWMDAFSKTGTIHVLAVSGLHVGIIFIMLSFLLRLKGSKGRSLIIKSVVAMLVLFLYCLVTGFSPSVSRASLMFGTVIIVKAFKRNSNIYNTLTFAAFVLLIINPMNLYNVGFQFSFLAVIGIVYYKDYFRALWPQYTWIGDKVITLLSVSIAAQINTFPIGLYYFHQYPNLFMFSNLIVIPCITVILYSGIFFIAFGWISESIAEFFARISEVYITFISRIVHYIQDVPYAFFENVHISFSQMLLIYVFIITLTISLVHKWSYGFMWSLLAVAAFLFSDYKYDRSMASVQVVCFDVRNETLIGFKEENAITFIASEGVFQDVSKVDFIITPYLVKERLTESYSVVPLQCIANEQKHGRLSILGKGMVCFDNKSYLFLDKLKDYVNDTINTDYVIIGKEKNSQYISKVLPLINSKKTIILDNWRMEELKAEDKSNNSVIQSKGCVILN
ncbi:ComEC/Rec2 family competence protein [Bacteroidia bacterium]|nr:ComEC/Rec2 family competence protein [Bacteroidia bacterium]MDB9883195.1 ComEC/Rec2 family competence protein [Bacteroidia bacterium]